MAVSEGKDRSVGVDSEKLLTLEEAARRLGIPADDVEAMVQGGRLAAFRLGGSLLRVRATDVEAVRAQRPHGSMGPEERLEIMQGEDEAGGMDRVVRGSSSLSSDLVPVAHVSSRWARLADFLYFNDFYLISILIILILLALILTL
jgi:excisionase family DNA binding protein